MIVWPQGLFNAHVLGLKRFNWQLSNFCNKLGKSLFANKLGKFERIQILVPEISAKGAKIKFNYLKRNF